MIYTLDTSVVVDALRQPAELDRLKSFLSWALPSIVLSSVVRSELTSGARTEKGLEALDTLFVGPFARRGRIIAPGVAAWRRAGMILGARGGKQSASHLNDVLLACQAREFGWTIITRDTDFGSLRRVVTGLAVSAPFPARP